MPDLLHHPFTYQASRWPAGESSGLGVPSSIPLRFIEATYSASQRRRELQRTRRPSGPPFAPPGATLLRVGCSSSAGPSCSAGAGWSRHPECRHRGSGSVHRDPAAHQRRDSRRDQPALCSTKAPRRPRRWEEAHRRPGKNSLPLGTPQFTGFGGSSRFYARRSRCAGARMLPAPPRANAAGRRLERGSARRA